MKKFKCGMVFLVLVGISIHNMALANTKITSHAFTKPGSRISINPQPEPPGKASNTFIAPWMKRGFNPQPEPPAAPQSMN